MKVMNLNSRGFQWDQHPCKNFAFQGAGHSKRMYAKTRSVSFHFSSLELGVPWGWINSNFSFQVSWCDHRGCFWKFFVNEPETLCIYNIGTRAGMTWWFLADLSGSIACHDDYGLCFLLDSWGTGSCRLQVAGYGLDTTKSLPLPGASIFWLFVLLQKYVGMRSYIRYYKIIHMYLAGVLQTQGCLQNTVARFGEEIAMNWLQIDPTKTERSTNGTNWLHLGTISITQLTTEASQ